MSEALEQTVLDFLAEQSSFQIHSTHRRQIGPLIFYEPCRHDITRGDSWCVNHYDMFGIAVIQRFSLEYFRNPHRLTATEALIKQKDERQIFLNIFRTN